MKLSHDRKNEFPFFKSNAIPLLLASLPALLIGLAFGMGKIVRDCSLTCNVGYELAPIAILAMGIVSIPISSLTVRWANRLGYRRWQLLSLGFVAVSFVLFWGSTYFVLTMMAETTITDSPASLWTFPLGFIYLCFFIWLGAVGAIVAPNIKTTVYKLFDDEQRASALAITSAAIILGSLAGAFLGGEIMSYVLRKLAVRYELARDSLIIIMGLITLLVLPAIIKLAEKVLFRFQPAPSSTGCNCCFCFIISIAAVILIAINLHQYWKLGWSKLAWISAIIIPVTALACGIMSRRQGCKRAQKR